MKKLFDFKMAGSVLLMLAISLASCKQDFTVQPTPSVEQVAPDKVVDLDIQGVEIKDGILHFKDAKSLNEALKIFGKSNYWSTKAFFTKIGFESLEMIGNEQFDVLDKLKTPEQFEEFKLRNKNIFSFDNKEIKLKCYSHIMPSLINQEGIVFIGESVCKYDDKGLIIVDDGNLEKLNRTIVSRKSSLNDKISVFNVNQLQLETRAACGTNPNTGWIGGNNWRRGILSCGTEISVPVQNGSSSFSFDFFSFSSGRAQKYLTWFGYWTGVNTSHTLSVNQVANVWVDNAMTINVNKSYYLTFSSTGVSEIKFSEYLGTINDFNAFSRDEAINNAFTMFKNFTSINNTYSNGGGVNASLICQ